MRDARLTILTGGESSLQVELTATEPTDAAQAANEALTEAAEEARAAAEAEAAAAAASGGKKKKPGKAEAAEEAASQPSGPPPLLWPSPRHWHALVAVEALNEGSDAAAAAAALASDPDAGAASGDDKKKDSKKAGKKGGAKDKKKDAAGADEAPVDTTVRALPPSDAAVRPRVFALGGEGPGGLCADALWVLDLDRQTWFNPPVVMCADEARQAEEEAEGAGRADAPRFPGDEVGVPWAGAVMAAAGLAAPDGAAGAAAASESATPAPASPAPLPRSRFAAVYVPDHREIVLQGGHDGTRARSDAWALHVDSLRWRRIRVPTLPALITVPTSGLGPEDEAPEADAEAPRLLGPAPAPTAWHTAVWAAIPARFLTAPGRPTPQVYSLAEPEAEPEEAAGKKGGKKGGGKDKKKDAKKKDTGKKGAKAKAEPEAAPQPERQPEPWEGVHRILCIGGAARRTSSGAEARAAVAEAAARIVNTHAAKAANAAEAAAETEGTPPPVAHLQEWASGLLLDHEEADPNSLGGAACLWALDPVTGRWDIVTARSGLSSPLATAARWTTASASDSRSTAALRPEPEWRGAADEDASQNLQVCGVLSRLLRPAVVVSEALVPLPPGLARPPSSTGAVTEPPAAAGTEPSAEAVTDAAPVEAPGEGAAVTVTRLVIAGGEQVAQARARGVASAPLPSVWVLELPPWSPAEEEAARRAAAADAHSKAPASAAGGRRECTDAPCPDGALFTGVMVHGVRDGEGRAVWEAPGAGTAVPVPVEFEGLWRGGAPRRGRLVWSDGVVDEGPWVIVGDAAQAEAAGTGGPGGPFCGPHRWGLDGAGSRQYSEAPHHSRSGAELVRKAGGSYEGSFARGDEEGMGLLERPDGTWVRGHWVSGLPHGDGSELDESGDVFRGAFHEGLRDGGGRVEYSAGGWYNGGWRRGKRAGPGEEETPELHRFRGKFSSGKRNGLGHCLFSDGGQFEGCWRDGVRQGEGSMVWASGRTYGGAWEDGLPHGVGTGWFPDLGLEFSGEWRRGLPEGRGRCVYSGGEPEGELRVYEGTMVRGKEEGSGRCRYADGCVYVGAWLGGHRHGKGQLTVAFAGAVVAGEWVGGALRGEAELRLEEEDEATLEDVAGEWRSPGRLGSTTANGRDELRGHTLRPRPKSRGQVAAMTKTGVDSGSGIVADAVANLQARARGPAPAGVFTLVADEHGLASVE